MTIFAELLERSAQVVVIDRWTGVDGWPAFRVFFLGEPFGTLGERYVECPGHPQAIEVAGILATCSGWPIIDLSKGER